jgi:hypothetical protein
VIFTPQCGEKGKRGVRQNALVKRRTRLVGRTDLDLHEEGAVASTFFRAVDCFEKKGKRRKERTVNFNDSGKATSWSSSEA